MTQTTIILSPAYGAMRPFLASLPARFGEGRLLHAGRNEIRAFEENGCVVVVKRFGRLNPLRRVVYSFFRTDKARRSYRNALALVERGIPTPAPVACVVVKRWGLVDSLFYACEETQAKAVKGEFIGKHPWNRPLLEAYAAFVATLHERGVLHRDLNPTNILYEQAPDGRFSFTLIDVNRMAFYRHPVSKRARMENLTLFWWLSPVWRAMLDSYARHCGWTQADIDKAVRVKQRHDLRWVRRKRLTGHFK